LVWLEGEVLGFGLSLGLSLDGKVLGLGLASQVFVNITVNNILYVSVLSFFLV